MPVVENDANRNTRFYEDVSLFPAIGESDLLYIDKTNNKLYQWIDSAYEEITGLATLGDTSTTAYWGDKGKIAYDHSLTTHYPLYESVTLGATINTGLPTLLRLYNNAGVLTGVRPSRHFTKFFQSYAGGANTCSEVRALQIGSSVVFAYRDSNGYPVVQAFDFSTATPTKGTAVIVLSASSTGLSLATDGTNILLTFTTATAINAYPFLLKADKVTIWDGTTDNQTGAKLEIAAASAGQSTKSRCAVYDTVAARFVVAFWGGGTPCNVTLSTVTIAGNPVVATLNKTQTTTTLAGEWLTIGWDAGQNCVAIAYSRSASYIGKAVITAGAPDTITISSFASFQAYGGTNLNYQPHFIYANSELLLFYLDRVTYGEYYQRLYLVSRINNSGATPTTTQLFTLASGGCDSISVTYDTTLGGWIAAILNISSLSYRIYFIQKYDATNYIVNRVQNYAYDGSITSTQPMSIVFDTTNNITVGLFKNTGSTNQTGMIITNVYDDKNLCPFVLNAAGNIGATVNMIKRGHRIDGFSGLIPGAEYYWQSDGQVGLTRNHEFAGTALSSSILASEPREESWIL